MDIQKVFIIGAGQMGSGIAQLAASHGFDVMLQDTLASAVQKALGDIQDQLAALVKKGKMTDAEMQNTLARIATTGDIAEGADADLFIEAATENTEVKNDIFQYVDAIAKPEALIASCTSSTSITELAAQTRRPEQVVGLHFFNPAPAMKLLEVTRGYSTSEETLSAALAFGEATGKVTIVSQDKPGFIVNRMFDLYLNEAVFLVEEGVGTPEDIDKGMMYGLNHPMGPLALLDLIGLDVVLEVLEVFQREYGEAKYRPAPLLRKMVRAGKLGRKTGEGFYKYS